MIGLAMAAIIISSIFTILVALLQLSVGLNSIQKALNVTGRATAVCTSMEDAKKQAQRVAESSVTYVNVEDVKAEIKYVQARSQWEAGTFVRVTVSGKVKTMAPFITGQRSKSVLICIENGGGNVITIPEMYESKKIIFGGRYTYYEYPQYPNMHGSWKSGTLQRKLYDKWVAAGKQYKNGVAVYKGKYLVAVTETFGQAGDEIQIILKNGTKINCIIADIKGNATKYGHLYGNKDQIEVVEAEIQLDYPGSEGGSVVNWIPQWNSPPTKIINKGSVF